MQFAKPKNVLEELKAAAAEAWLWAQAQNLLLLTAVLPLEVPILRQQLAELRSKLREASLVFARAQ